MSESAGKAVFLSYASQDAGAAKRICDALRAAGVEVWFDQDALVGGDAWDTKIRGQISSCALFIPVVSANTQAREEGYFRLEWKLAEDRSHLMAKGRAFIVPVTVDGTSERGAEVPDAFLRVQWTKLPGGEASSAFVARVQKLLGGPGTPAAAPAALSQPSAVTPARKSSPLTWAVGSLGIIVLALIGYIMLRPGMKDAALAKSIAEKKAGPVVPAISAKSIAVLPFTNLSDDKDSRVFADGVHEDVLTDLALIRDLHVVSRTSVEQYRDAKKPMRQIGMELGVAYLLEGSVRRAGNTIRITGQLIRAATDEHVWAKKFDRELKDVFEIQTEIATEIAAALHTALSPQEKKLIEAAPTASLDAYDLFLQARDVRNRLGDTGSSVAEQAELFERAVAIDPQFGKAWAKLAWALSFLYSVGIEQTEARLARATEALGMAERLIPDTPELLLSRGQVFLYARLDFPRALEDFRKAAVLAPSFSEVRLAMALTYRRQRQWQKAIDSLAEAERIDPKNPLHSTNLFGLMLAGRRFAEAEAAQRRAMELGQNIEIGKRALALLPFLARGEMPSKETVKALAPADQRSLARAIGTELPLAEEIGGTRKNLSPLDLQHRAFLLAAQGNISEVRSVLATPAESNRLLVQREPTNARAWARLGVIEALLGNRDEALRSVRKAMELVPESKDPWLGPLNQIDHATVLAWTGDVDGAIKEYARLLQVPFHRWSGTGGGELNVHVMRRHPKFAPLRNDPRFQALLDDPKNNAPLF